MSYTLAEIDIAICSVFGVQNGKGRLGIKEFGDLSNDRWFALRDAIVEAFVSGLNTSYTSLLRTVWKDVKKYGYMKPTDYQPE